MKHGLIEYCLLIGICASAFGLSDFAAEVVDFQGAFYATGLYDDPNAILGKPALRCRNRQIPGFPFVPDFRVKIVEGAYYLSLDDRPVITELYPEEWIAVRFDHKVMDYPGNPYGRDLIVFGNSLFEYDGSFVGDSTNMNTLKLADPAAGYFEQIRLSVSQDGLTWYSFDPNRMDPNSICYADALFPTQAWHWNRAGACWTDREMDFTRPVDPNLTLADFSGLTAADAVDLYRGSGGGAPFDLCDLPDFQALSIDPETGCRWIQYVRLEGGSGPDAVGGEVDAVADVAGCGDPLHPRPPGDLNQDCRINMDDVLLLSRQWLADRNLDDLLDLAENWLACTYRCQ
jgi:hypothetical protein